MSNPGQRRLGSLELSFIQIVLCVLCVFVLSFFGHSALPPPRVGVPLESALWRLSLLPLGPIVSDNSLAPPFEGCCLQAIYRPCPVLIRVNSQGQRWQNNSGGWTVMCVCVRVYVLRP